MVFSVSVIIAIFPVFLTILCGWLLSSRQFVDASFWRGAEKLVYFVLFPALLFSRLSQADISQINFSLMVSVITLMLLIVSALMIVLKPWISTNNAQFSSILQGGMRHNTYIAFSVIASLYGSDGLVIGVILVATMIAVLNVVCVLVMEIYVGDTEAVTHQSPWRIPKSLITNPLLFTCIIGAIVNALEWNTPVIIHDFLSILAHAALPLGLLVVGAALNIKAIGSAMFPIVISSISKFLVVPLVAMVLCHYLEVDLLSQQVLLVLCMVPTATSAYVLAKQMGGDAELMATIITAQTLLAAVAMPVLIGASNAWLLVE